jgi:uncharacterized phiE125 gp8 family phage protein
VALTLVIAPSGELLPAAELLDWVRADNVSQHRDEVARLIRAAETSFQEHTGRQLRAATYQLTRRAFPPCGRAFRLPKPPTVSVTQIRYRDLTGAWQVLDAANYQVSSDGEQGVFSVISPAPLTFWPFVEYGREGAVEVTFTAGMYAASERPDEEIVLRLKAYVGLKFERRDGTDPEGSPEWEANLWLPWNTGEVV